MTALSTCSRRISGSVRTRALSMTTSGSHPLGLRSSNTLSSLDLLAAQDALKASISTSGSTGCALDALGFLSCSTSVNSNTKHHSFATLGRIPPPRKPIWNGTSFVFSETIHYWLCSRGQFPPAHSLPHIVHAYTGLMASSRKRHRLRVSHPSVCKPPVASGTFAMLQHQHEYARQP